VLDCKIICYILLIIENTTGIPHLKTGVLWYDTVASQYCREIYMRGYC